MSAMGPAMLASGRRGVPRLLPARRPLRKRACSPSTHPPRAPCHLSATRPLISTHPPTLDPFPAPRRHLPLWVAPNERKQIEAKLEGWVERLLESGADVRRLSALLSKPLRPLWISQSSVIWTNQVRI